MAFLWQDLRYAARALARAPAVSGVACGLGGAFLTTRFLASFLFEVERRDPTAVLAASVFLAACCLVAVLAPARRAAAVSPSVALRES